jgi:integrase
VKLTAKAVAALTLPAGKTDAIHFDDELRGFGYRLRLGSDGKVRRTWVCQYRRAGGTRRMLLGAAGVLSAEAARLAARKVLGAVALGHDPQADRIDRRGRDQVSMRNMVDEYLNAKQLQLRPRTFVETKRYLTTDYFKPLLGMPLDTITRRDIAARLVIIARERGNPTAARARAALSSFFVWAVRMGVVESNPTIGTIKPPEGKPRERVLSDIELAAIWKSCKDDDYGRIIKLLILTASRRAEIGNMAWSELDDPERPTTFTIAAARSKNGKPHTLPVTPLMRDVIISVPRMAARDQVFGLRTYGFTGWADGKAALDRRSRVSGWLVHDIRRTAATRMADIGIQPWIIEQILNHQSGHKGGVAGIYNRSSYEREVRNALQIWHDHVRSAVEGGARKIVPFTHPEAV